MNGLKFWVIAFCWLDSTVSTEEPPLELAALVALTVELLFELPPQPAISAAAPSAAHAASQLRCLIHRFMEGYTFSLIKEPCRVCRHSRPLVLARVVSRM